VRRAAVVVVVTLGGVGVVLLVGGFILAGIDEAVGSYPGHELLRAWIRASKSSWWLRVVVDVAVGLLLLGGAVWYVLEWFDLFGFGFGSASRRSGSDGD
jgi:hypothetical protein